MPSFTHFDEQGNALKITFDGDTRRKQKNLRDDAKKTNLAKIDGGNYGLNVSETPGVEVAPPGDLLTMGKSQVAQKPSVTESPFDLLTPQPAQTDQPAQSVFTPGFGPNLSSSN